MRIKYNDYPIEECMEAAAKLVESGATVHQKWTCKHCGDRQAMEEPNKFFRAGRCEKCGKDTVIRKCNYLVMTTI